MRTGRGTGAVRGLLVILIGLALSIAPAAAQMSKMDSAPTWRNLAREAAELTRGITVGGEPYVRHGSMYDPAKRVIHDQGADIDYPVRLPEEEWRSRLSDQEYYVLREDGTERAFANPLYDNKRRGIYYSAATGQPLFHSDDKYKSGTGWPSFTKPISPDAVAYMWDRGLFTRRIEVIDSLSGSHIGHVFSDGPEPTGQRYCMNSAALIFVAEGGDPPEIAREWAGRN